MAGWGLLPWGLGPWGLGVASLSMVSAEAVATRTVRVILSRAPQAVSAVTTGDALNPATWSVTRLDTGQAFTVLGAEMASDEQVDLLLLEPLAGYLIIHEVDAPTLLAAGGAQLIGSTTSAQFPGLAWEQAGKHGEFDRDVANPPAGGTSQSLGGTLVVVGGDYATEQGAALAKKMAFRDLFTPRGAFAHLPSYGFGLAERVKQGVHPSELPGLAADITRVLKSRPWVEDASTGVSFDSDNGILSLGFQLKVKNGAPVRFGLRVNTQGAVVF